ncbi:hypothetical protein BDV29DRAFT_183501 [Aspergillus leporis]|uniref:Uncharacterized protein n=1 Tax=Aspergillus leporis TaxID=41062 RepID=A0A5N5WMX9_9EURO|nr:hypothetical protein BDV29DRAFT_183501 [Aspergillus leporis]
MVFFLTTLFFLRISLFSKDILNMYCSWFHPFLFLLSSTFLPLLNSRKWFSRILYLHTLSRVSLRYYLSKIHCDRMLSATLNIFIDLQGPLEDPDTFLFMTSLINNKDFLQLLHFVLAVFSRLCPTDAANLLGRIQHESSHLAQFRVWIDPHGQPVNSPTALFSSLSSTQLGTPDKLRESSFTPDTVGNVSPSESFHTSGTLAPQCSFPNQSFYTDNQTSQASWPGPENLEDQMAEWVHQFVCNKIEPVTPPSPLQQFPIEEPKNISTIQSTGSTAATFPAQEDEAARTINPVHLLPSPVQSPDVETPKSQPQVKEETPLPISPLESVSEASSNTRTNIVINTQTSNLTNQHDPVIRHPVNIDEGGLLNITAEGIEVKNGRLPSNKMQCKNTALESENIEVPPVLDVIPVAGASPEMQGPPLSEDEMDKLLQTTLKAATGKTLTTAQAKEVNKACSGRTIPPDLSQFLSTDLGLGADNGGQFFRHVISPNFPSSRAACVAYFKALVPKITPHSHVEEVSCRINQIWLHLFFKDYVRELKQKDDQGLLVKIRENRSIPCVAGDFILKDVYGDEFERQKDYRNRLQTQCRWGNRWWRVASCAGLGVVLFAIGELAKKIGKTTSFQIPMVNALAIHLLNTYPGLVSFFQFTQPITLHVMLGRGFPILSDIDTQALLDEASKPDLRTQQFPKTWQATNPGTASASIEPDVVAFSKKYFSEDKAAGSFDTMQLD